VPAEELEQAATRAVRQNLPGRKPGRRGGQQQCQLQRLRTIAALLVPQTAQWNERANGWK
jgi:hypothetical protein